MSDLKGGLAVVTGASGFVGSHVVDELLRSGARVRCILRDTSPRRWLAGKPVEIVTAPLVDHARLAAAVAGADWIVHSAGITSARGPAEYHEANVKGTERMLRATMTVNGLKRFVLISSQAAAGPSADGKPVTETTLPQPVSVYGMSKLRSEELTMLMREGLPVVAIRPPAVYGPRDEAILKVFIAVKRHIQPVLRGGGRFSLVHAEDLARAVCLALTHERAPGEVFFVAEPDTTDYDQMGGLVKEALGTWAVRLQVPGFALIGGALIGEAIGALLGKPPFLSREKLREIGSGDWICDSAKIRTRLGWTPRIPLRDGILATAKWYREAGWV
ncbi:MAG TPA: NAD-dependent epimerase/dehydratase family protein [Candidatus Eisenbacteria bacterium]|nr:NAD-dependent epimerase/dehydratase family protein [Candidatus Eisenbacteria bacterium]